MENKKDSGFTLIELIVVVAIIAVMALALYGFISVGSFGFNSTSTSAKTQIELQRISDHVQDLLLDTNHCVNVNDAANTPMDTASVPERTKVDIFKYVKDSDYADDTDTGRRVHVTLTWEKATGTLTYKQEEQRISEIKVEDVVVDGGVVTTADEIIGTGITNFQVDATKAAADKKVEVYLAMEKRGRKMDLKQTISLRNTVSANVAGFNITQYPRKYNQVSLTILFPENVTKDTQTEFQCKISGYVRNTRLKWEILGGTETEPDAAWKKSSFVGKIFHAKGTGFVTIQVTALGDPSTPQKTAQATFYVS